MKTNWKNISLNELAGLEMEGYDFQIDGDGQKIKLIPPEEVD